jgi:hypothetical protein
MWILRTKRAAIREQIPPVDTTATKMDQGRRVREILERPPYKMIRVRIEKIVNTSQGVRRLAACIGVVLYKIFKRMIEKIA